MLTVIVRRLLLAIPTLLALTALLFFSVTTILGTPASMMLGEDASPKAIAELNARYGFDRPAYVQYVDWLGQALTGDFGRSYTSQDPVGAAIAAALPVRSSRPGRSLPPSQAAVGLNSLPNMPGLRRFVVLGNLVGITMPNFILGIGLIFLFSVQLGWLPTTGWVPWSDGVLAHLRHMIMPVLTLSAYYFGRLSLVYRAERRRLSPALYPHRTRQGTVARQGCLQARPAERHTAGDHLCGSLDGPPHRRCGRDRDGVLHAGRRTAVRAGRSRAAIFRSCSRSAWSWWWAW